MEMVGSVLNLKETELCLGLPGGCGNEPGTPKATGKRGFSETVDLLELNFQSKEDLKEKTNTGTDPKEKNLLPCNKDPAKPPAK